MFQSSRLVVFVLVALDVLGVAVTLATADDQPAAPKVELKAVKYDALEDAVSKQRGKVVVVDVWADFCLPCKKAFPHLLEMQQRHGKDGLVCMSLSVDPPDRRAAALKFLQDRKATIANYWLDEKESVWQEKFDSGGPPVVLVFDRQGKRVAKFDNNDPDKTFTPDDVEKLVKKLLKAQN